MRPLLALCAAALLAAPVCAQEFRPPDESAAPNGTRLGLYGFGVRTGVDFTRRGRLALGASLDFGQLFTAQLRLRPVGEVSVFNGPNTYVGALDAIYLFTPPDAVARPYAGIGAALVGGERCSADPDCPALWLNVVVGFELRFRPTFNWMLEYHGMNLLRENRILIGLTTRSGG